MQHLQSIRARYKALRHARANLVKAFEAALWRRKDWEDSGPDPADTTGRRRLWKWQGAPPAGGKVPRPRTQIRKPGTGRGAARQEQETTPMKRKRPPAVVVTEEEAERLGRQFVEQHEDPEFARMAMQRLGAERHMLLNQALLERAARAGLRNARVRRPSPAVVAAYVRGLLAAVEGLPVMDQEVSNELLARRDAAVRARRGQ